MIASAKRNEQVNSYASAHKRGSKNQHVVRHADGWAVKTPGAKRATQTFSTQKEAEARGKTLAKKNKSELFIHGKDGRIRERNSYGPDPFPPKG